MPEVRIGTRHEHTLVVTSDIAINFLGVEEGRVLGTPYLIWHLEMAARDAIKTQLEDGFDSVGTEVHVKHLAATPMGMPVTFRAEIVHVDGNRVRSRVEAFDEKEKVAEGVHERYVIDVARFAAGLAKKRAGA